MVVQRKLKTQNLKDAGQYNRCEQETRQEILRVGLDLFRARGFKGVSMRDMAEALSITPAALYYHFPHGKEELFLDVIKNLFEKQSQEVRNLVKPDINTQVNLLHLSIYLLKRHARDDNSLSLLRDVHLNISKSRQEEIWKYYNLTYNKTLNDIFQDEINRGGLLETVPAHILATAFNGLVLSFSFNPEFRETLKDPVEMERLAFTAVTVFLDGAGQSQLNSSM